MAAPLACSTSASSSARAISAARNAISFSYEFTYFDLRCWGRRAAVPVPGCLRAPDVLPPRPAGRVWLKSQNMVQVSDEHVAESRHVLPSHRT